MFRIPVLIVLFLLASSAIADVMHPRVLDGGGKPAASFAYRISGSIGGGLSLPSGQSLATAPVADLHPGFYAELARIQQAPNAADPVWLELAAGSVPASHMTAPRVCSLSRLPILERI